MAVRCCGNSPDVFCYICGFYASVKERQNISALAKQMTICKVSRKQLIEGRCPNLRVIYIYSNRIIRFFSYMFYFYNFNLIQEIYSENTKVKVRRAQIRESNFRFIRVGNYEYRRLKYFIYLWFFNKLFNYFCGGNHISIYS